MAIEVRVLDAAKLPATAATKTEAGTVQASADAVVEASPPPESPIVSEQPPPVPDLAVPGNPAPQPSASASAAAPPRPDHSPDPISSATAEASSVLDRGPQPLDDIEPAFPMAAGARGGAVTLHLVISDQGVVESVEVVASSPPGLFDAAAVAAFAHARFSPGLKGGMPVRSEIRYEVSFAPVGRGSEVSGRTY